MHAHLSSQPSKHMIYPCSVIQSVFRAHDLPLLCHTLETVSTALLLFKLSGEEKACSDPNAQGGCNNSQANGGADVTAQVFCH